MIYRVPSDWIEKRRRLATIAAPLAALLPILILVLVLGPRVDWSKPQDRRAAIFVAAILCVGTLVGFLAGRMSFRAKMNRWESFQVELTLEELVRQMDGEETRIQRSNVQSIREYPQRGFVITDNRGWRIFVPKLIANYQDFRERMLTWTIKA
jgi:hypothetical protein